VFRLERSGERRGGGGRERGRGGGGSGCGVGTSCVETVRVGGGVEQGGTHP